MLPRPRIRLPLWSVPVIVLALYVARSLVRGSWALEMPMDVVLVVMTAVVMVAVWRLRAMAAEDEPDGVEDEDDRGASRDDAESPTR